MEWLPVQIGGRVVASRPARLRSVLFIAVGAIATVCGLAVASGISVRDREASRAASVEPLFGDVDESSLGYTSLTQTYKGQTVLLVRLAARAETEVRPPGIEDLPSPGTVVVSPRLARLMEAEPELRAWFAPHQVTVLPRAGVGSAGELRAYIGVPPDQLGSVEGGEVIAFGAASASGRGFGWYEAAGFGLFVALPAAGLLITASRFGRSARNQRNLALRLAGMSSASANTIGAIEMAVPVAAGAVLAAVAYHLALPDYMTVPVVDRAVFGADARPPLTATVGVLVVLTAVSALLGAGSAKRASPLLRLGSLLSPRRLTSPRSVGVFLAGLAAVAAAWVRADPRDPILWIAILLLGAGLPGATAFAAHVVARGLIRPQAGVSRLIAMRRIAADPQAATRIAGTVAIAVFVVAAAQPITQVIANPTDDWVATAREVGQQTILSRAETLEAVPLNLDAPSPAGVAPVIPAVGLWSDEQGPDGRPSTTALIATCADLRDLTDAELPECRGARLRLTSPGSGEEGATSLGGLMMRSADRRSVTEIEPPTSVLELPEDRLPIDASLVLPPDDPAVAAIPQPYVAAVYMRVSADQSSWEAARSWVIASSPAHRLENAFEASATRDNTGSWVLLGLIVTAVITALAAMLIAGDDAGRRKEWFGLRAIGMSRAQVVTIQVGESVTTGLLATSLAVLAGVAVGSTFLQVGDDSLSTNANYVAAGVGGLLVIVATAVATSAAVHRQALA